MALQTGDEKHEAAATSTLDVTWVLYDQVLDVTPDRSRPARDRFCSARATARWPTTRCSRPKASSGSSGSPTSATFALRSATILTATWSPGRDLLGLPRSWPSPRDRQTRLVCGPRVIRSRGLTLVGDGELDEGTTPRRSLRRSPRASTAHRVAIDNQLRPLGWPGGIETPLRRRGLGVTRVDGRDHVRACAALASYSTSTRRLWSSPRWRGTDEPEMRTSSSESRRPTSSTTTCRSRSCWPTSPSSTSPTRPRGTRTASSTSASASSSRSMWVQGSR